MAAVRLLGKWADRHMRDHDGRTPIDWARRFGSTRLLDVLLYDPSKVRVYILFPRLNLPCVLLLVIIEGF